VELTIFPEASVLELPVRPADAADALLPPFGAPEGAARAPYTELRPARVERTVERDGGEVVETIASEGGAFRAGGPGRLDAIDLGIEESSLRRYRIHDDDPLS